MAMTYDAFLDQMKKDLEAGFAEDLPAKYSQVKIGIRDVEKLQGESYRGISFRVGDAPIEGNLNMQQAYQAHEAGVPYESILRDTVEEAAAYSGVGRNKLRELTDSEQCSFVLWVGSKRLIKRRLLDEFLDNMYSV